MFARAAQEEIKSVITLERFILFSTALTIRVVNILYPFLLLFPLYFAFISQET